MILLVNPKQFEEKVYYINLGLATLAAIIRDAGYETHVVDFDSLKFRGKELGEIPGASIVLVSGMITNLSNICAAVEAVRRQSPTATFVLGGGAASAATNEIYEYLAKWFDYYVIGEGDEIVVPLLAFLAGRSGRRPPNVYCWNKDSRTIQGSGTSAAPPDVTNVPMPAYEQFDTDSYVTYLRGTGRSFEIYASKGCPYDCSFCYRISGSQVRYRKVSRVIAEMDYICRRYGIRSFSFEDDSFGMNGGWLKEFCASVRSRGYRFRFQAQLASLKNTEKLNMMRDAGLFGISMGIESGSPTILRTLNKRNDLSVASEIIRYCNANNIMASGTFILGSPGESWTTVEETKSFLIDNPLHDFQLFFLSPYPGTSLFNYAMNSGMIPDTVEYVLRYKCLDELNLNLTSVPDSTLYEMRNYIIKSVESAHGRAIASPVSWKRDVAKI